jgi:TetR/AcrR family transcriptional regulator, transcriptional repressor of bet genes
MARNGPIRDQRRQELIRATIAVIARRGYSGTTIARVAEKAGVSLGLVNFHFESKDRLFRETFLHLAEEYEAVWQRRLAATAADPTAQATAMVESYFDREVFTREKLAVWFTFWSDAELRGRYRAAATRIERRYVAALETEIARRLRKDGRTAAQARAVAAGLSAMIDGFWLQAMIYPGRFDRRGAVDACLDFLELSLATAAKPARAAPARAALARAAAAS